MRWTEIPAGGLHAAEQRLRVALGDRADDLVTLVNADRSFANLVASDIMKRIAEKRIESLNLNPWWERNWEKARKIMGQDNFFGIKEAIRHFNVKTDYQRVENVFSEIPFSEDVLKQSRNTHILVAVFPLSISEMQEHINVNCDVWYYEISRNRCEMGWHLIRKTQVKNSFRKEWRKQETLIGEYEEVPTVQLMLYTVIGHYLTTGKRLFKDIYVRTSSVINSAGPVDSCYLRVIVGSFRSGGVCINCCYDNIHVELLGISSAVIVKK